MTTESKTQLTLVRRERFGKKNRALRREGVIPANIYGHNLQSVAVQVPGDDLRHLLRRSGRNEIIYVQIDGEERPTFVRDIQRNPVTDQILHVDFMQISLQEKVRLEVSIHFTGIAPAVDTHGGILTHSMNQIQVEALPTSIPSSIEIDVSFLTEIGQSIHVRDIVPPANVVIISEPESVVVRVDLPAAERAEEVEAVEGEVTEEGAEPGAEGAPVAEGAAEKGEQSAPGGRA